MNVAFANSSPRRYRWDAVALGISMLAAGIMAVLVRPSAEPSAHPVLARLVPVSFGEWTAVPDSTVRVIDPTASSPYDPDADHPYSDVLMRTYSNSRGDVVQLALAYGQEQKQEVKIHRPAPCYMAQGFEILAHSLTTILLRGAAPVSGARMLVRSPGRVEAVSYWIRIGRIYSTSGWQTRYYLFKQALQGRIVDGILVRVSQIVASPEGASAERYEIQERFLADLIDAMPSGWRDVLLKD